MLGWFACRSHTGPHWRKAVPVSDLLQVLRGQVEHAGTCANPLARETLPVSALQEAIRSEKLHEETRGVQLYAEANARQPENGRRLRICLANHRGFRIYAESNAQFPKERSA